MRFRLDIDGRSTDVVLEESDEGFIATVDGTKVTCAVERTRDGFHIDADGASHVVRITGRRLTLDGDDVSVVVRDLDRVAAGPHHHHGPAGEVRPPMPGRVVSVKVKPGDEVRAGDTLVVLEAMKMQNDIVSPADATVKEVRVAPGRSVEAKDVLVVLG